MGFCAVPLSDGQTSGGGMELGVVDVCPIVRAGRIESVCKRSFGPIRAINRGRYGIVCLCINVYEIA